MEREYYINLIYSRFGTDIQYTKDDLLTMELEELKVIATQDDINIY